MQGERRVSTVMKESASKGDGGEKASAVESFYEKLSKMNQSSGLTLVFNFRDTILDLYLFYKEVIQRGGFNQVTMDRRWDEVGSALNLKSNNGMLSDQLRRAYENLLYQYEQAHHYRTPPGKGCSKEKRKHCENVLSSIVHCLDESDSPAAKRNRAVDIRQESSTGPQTPEQKQTLKKQAKGRELKKDLDVPVRPRTSYQMFLKIECDRLRKLHGENSSNMNIRNIAVDAWKQLSESDKEPYVEASKADRERFSQEMDAFVLHRDEQEAKARIQKTPNTSLAPRMLNFSTSPETDRDYYVTTFDPESGEFILPEESLVETTVHTLKHADPNDPLFHINWDEYEDEFPDDTPGGAQVTT